MDGSARGRRTPAQRVGDEAEGIVADRLAASGWTLLARDLHVGRREIDLVAVDPGPPACLVIIEVRWRRSRSHGMAEETVDHHKRRRLHEAAFILLEAGEVPRLPLRFDLVVVEPGVARGEPRVRHHRAAF